MLQIVEKLREKLEDIPSSKSCAHGVQAVLALINLALKKNLRNDKGEIIALPTDPENYLSFFDLTEISKHSEQKTWYTFVMQDSNNTLDSLHDPENGTLPLWKIRKSLKKALNEDFLTSVQMEATALPDIEMIFLRII